jgi:hypothetical protein
VYFIIEDKYRCGPPYISLLKIKTPSSWSTLYVYFIIEEVTLYVYFIIEDKNAAAGGAAHRGAHRHCPGGEMRPVGNQFVGPPFVYFSLLKIHTGHRLCVRRGDRCS